jgi:hypothetical protein
MSVADQMGATLWHQPIGEHQNGSTFLRDLILLAILIGECLCSGAFGCRTIIKTVMMRGWPDVADSDAFMLIRPMAARICPMSRL